MATEKRLIDANALQRLLLPIAMGLDKEYGSLGGAVSGVMMHIDNAPTVDAVEVVHGRWETVTEEDDEFWDYWEFEKCSECQKLSYSRYNYCPHCGAKMDGDKND